jgi:predicted amidohydrolase
MNIGLAAIQCRIGSKETFFSIKNLISKGMERNIEIFLLPEYFSYFQNCDFSKVTEKTIDFLKEESLDRNCVIAGNVILKGEEGYSNSLHIFDEGDLVGIQEKIHPTRSERELGIVPGKELKVFTIRKTKVSALICADILYPEICRVSALKGAEVILNPVISIVSSELPGREMRHCLYFARAFDSSAAIIKAGGPGKTFLGSETVGRSLIATPDGIIASFRDESSEELVFSEVDVKKLREYRKANYALHDRNIEAYRDLIVL